MKLFFPYESLDKKMRVILFTLLSLCFLALAFIFYNSILPPDKSAEQSTAVGSVIENIVVSVLPDDAEITESFYVGVRKLAHFLEFFMLGTFTALTVVLFSYRPVLVCVPSVLFGGLVGFLDETVQIFSGRGPAISDVWIDTFGYFTATALVILIYFASVAVLAKRKKEK